MSEGLKNLGYYLGNAVTPILPVHVGDDMTCFIMCKMLQNEGVFVNPVVSPAVEPGHALIRVSLMATHTTDQIDFALDKFQIVGKQLELL
jgi:8-amino-7-oxononanoate synthase